MKNHWKDPDAGKDWGQEEKGTTENEMVGWHHRLDGREFEQAPGDGEGQGSLACCSPWGHKEADTIEWLNGKLGLRVTVGWCQIPSSPSLYFLSHVQLVGCLIILLCHLLSLGLIPQGSGSTLICLHLHSPDLPNTLGKSPPDTAPIHGLSFQTPPPSGQGRLSLLVPSK